MKIYRSIESIALFGVAVFLLPMTSFAGPATGNCLAKAMTLSLGSTKTVTLRDEWDADWGEHTGAPVYWFKFSAQKGLDYTFYTTGASKPLGIWITAAEGADEFHYYDYDTAKDGVNVRAIFKYYAYWWESGMASSCTYYICISGDEDDMPVGSSLAVRLVSGIVPDMSAPVGSLEKPVSYDASKEETIQGKFLSNRADGGFYTYSAQMTGGIDYYVQLTPVGEKNVTDIEIGYRTYDPAFDSYSIDIITDKTVKNISDPDGRFVKYIFTPESDATYCVRLSGSPKSLFTFTHGLPLLRPVSEHESVPLGEGASVRFIPGKKNSDGSNYYDNIIDERLFCIAAEAGKMYSISTSGAATNVLMALYDANSNELLCRTSKVDSATFDVSMAFSLPKSGAYYVGICEDLFDERTDTPTGVEMAVSLREIDDGVSENVVQFRLMSLDANGGTVLPTSKIVAENQEVGRLPTPTRSGYSFKGWYTAAFGGSQVSANAVAGETSVLYAQWDIAQYEITYVETKGAANRNPTTYTITNEIAFASLPNVEGWDFAGWSPSSISLGSTGTKAVVAIWRRVYDMDEAVEADAQSASLPWTVGTNGVAAANGHDDATAVGGKSVKFTAADEASAWVETVVTNACRVTFDWKCSCEPLVKGRPYDYLAFAVDGEQQNLICGETGWTSVTNHVTGAGEHHLRWTFQRDEEGAAGEDCAWLANVVIDEIPPETFGEYLNWPEQAFTTGGDAEWTRAKGASEDGYALRSGVITHSQTSRLETVVSGPGSVTFACKVSGEIVKRIVFDGLAFCIDGVQQGELMGNADWATNTFAVEGSGFHTLSWLYVKDEDGSVGEDCAWVDAVSWAPAGGSTDTVVDMGGGKSVTVPGAWIEEHSALIEAAGGDAAAALNTPSANGRLSIADCYVLGLDPENEDATNDFRIVSFPMKADGTPDLGRFAFEPPQAKWNVPGARAVIKGAATPGGEWQEATEQNKATFRFFKVEVELP